MCPFDGTVRHFVSQNTYEMNQRIAEKLEELTALGRMTEFTKASIMEMTSRVARQLAGHHKKVQKGVEEIMGGKILNYKAKDILMQGRREGAMHCYVNAMDRGMSEEDALAIAGITREEGERAVCLRKEGKI